MPAVPPAGRGGMAAATFGAAWRGGIILPEPRKCMPLNRACKPAYAWREDFLLEGEVDRDVYGTH